MPALLSVGVLAIGLGVHDYLKTTSIGHVTRKGYDLLAPRANLFAEDESFDANAFAAMRSRAVKHSD